MNFFDLIKTFYSKERIDYPVDMSSNIACNKWLSLDKQNIAILNKLLPFLFYIEPKHYFYLLFFSIAKGRVPFLKKIEKQKEEKENKLLKEIQRVLCWSDRELEMAKPFLSDIDEKHWKMELGL